MILDIFNSQQQFNESFKSSCTKNCLMNILDHYKIANPIRYYDASLHFNVLKQGEVDPLQYFSKKDIFLESYQNKIKIHEYPKNADVQKVFEENCERINKGNPIIVDVDMYYIPYSPTVHRFHNIHSVIMCGYDKETVQLIDWYDWKFKGSVDLSIFLKARGSECESDESPYSGIPINNRWIEIVDYNWTGNTEDLLKETLQKSLYEFFERKSTESESYGITAMKEIVQEFELFRERNDKEKIEYIQISRKYATYLQSKFNLFNYYLKEANSQLNEPMIDALIYDIERNIKSWEIYLGMLLRSTFALNAMMYEDLIIQLQDIINHTEKLYDIIDNINHIL